jgi:hypothetical protein
MNCRLLAASVAALLAFLLGCSLTNSPGGTPADPVATDKPPAEGRRDEGVRIRQPLTPRTGNVAPPKSTLSDGLLWLARHQSPDGRWSSDGFGAACGKADGAAGCDGAGEAGFDVGVTGLALLAFVGAGFTHKHNADFNGIPVGNVVKKGLAWLTDRQDADGCIGGKQGFKSVLQHAIAALALSEAFGITSDAALKGPAQKAIDFIVQAQNPGAGWRYAAQCGDNDTFVTGWCVMALKSAQIANLEFPPAAFDGAKAWLDHVTDEAGRAGYDKPGSDPVVLPGRNERFANHDTMSAVAVMSRIFIDRNKRDPGLVTSADLLAADLPSREEPRIDYCYWYFGSLALFQLGPGGPRWKTWKGTLWPILEQTQRPPESGCRRGSWDPVDRWGCVGGRVYATAINCLPLECYYAYDVIFTDPPRPSQQ